jgi:osmotically-inducible protein OsmY
MQTHSFLAAALLSVEIVAITGAAVAGPQDTTQIRASGSTPGADHHQMLSRRVNAFLATSGTLAGSKIKVTAAGDTVILDGVVADAAAKERARELAMRVSGVRDIENNLATDRRGVETRRGEVVPDEKLSHRVAETLMRQLFPQARLEQGGSSQWEVDGEGWEIEVRADAGDITLTGHTARPDVIDDVISSARSVPGVRSVRSELGAKTFERPYGYMPEWGYHPYPVRRP